MTIDEAIKNLQKDLLTPGSVDKLDFQDSEQLGIEALKGIQRYRQNGNYAYVEKLPGETGI